jgi:class 3 adenylate cyclase/tetratricopeptide (TPR) repeat protein
VVERKLASVLFVDLVDSTGYVGSVDPEIVRRRQTQFFDRATRYITSHGGIVEKYAGDSVMAAFGVPQAHEDDAERAVRAGLAILQDTVELGLVARAGVESGEIVFDERESTFATGEAVNIAARLQQAAPEGGLLLGPSAMRLTLGRLEVEDAGPVKIRGDDRQVWSWRALCPAEFGRPLRSLGAPLVGREPELELLRNTYERAVRDRRPHLFTIFGEPGVGKTRLALEFLESLEGATVLTGRALPYGEGVTYWPLAKMVKVAAGISDDEPRAEALEKLVACCESEAVADLLALAAGVLEAVEDKGSQPEIAWAVRQWAEQMAREQPLVLVFEDVHWAEEPLLELIEHLVQWVRDMPLLVLCLARPELLEVHAGWGGGRLRATSIEIEPLGAADTALLLDELLEDIALPQAQITELIDKTGGNPLFVEETIRMLAESSDGRQRIPDTVQALIAARIDRLEPDAKSLLQCAALIGRTFWLGALRHLCAVDVDEALEELMRREFVRPEERSTISGDEAYYFKHVLIREVAYSGLSKARRATLHQRFAEWLEARTGDELVEIRAFHLDRAASLLAELDGDAPAELKRNAAAALGEAGQRALAREANRSARKLLLRAAELEPTLQRRHKAAVAAWRLDDFPAVASEMEEVSKRAQEEGDQVILGRSLNALAHVALLRDGDAPRAEQLAENARVLLTEDPPGHSDALMMLAEMAWWRGDLDTYERHALEAVEVGRAAGRADLESEAAQKVAQAYIARLQLDEAEAFVDRACALADESGSIGARAAALGSRGMLLSARGEADEAEQVLEQARTLYEEAGAVWPLARLLNGLAWIAQGRDDFGRAEKLFREAIRILKPVEDRGTLCESQRGLAQLLVRVGRLEEAERVALEARKTVGAHDQGSRATTRLALAQVRLAQGRDADAETLAREALEIIERTGFVATRRDVLRGLAAFLREHDRADEAEEYERQLAELMTSPAAAA